MRNCASAASMSEPSIAVEMIVMPRAPLSWPTNGSSAGWRISPAMSTLQKSSTCGRQFFVWSEIYSSSRSACSARW